jgi:alanine-synthesizing transaminase
MFTFARLDRLPPYVFATVNEIKMEARRSGKDIIDLGMGNPDLGTPQHIVDKLVESAQKTHNHRYSASMGITKLRMAIAGWYQRRFGVTIDPDTEAIATIGVKEGMSHLILVTIRPGDVVFTPNPTHHQLPPQPDHRGCGSGFFSKNRRLRQRTRHYGHP